MIINVCSIMFHYSFLWSWDVGCVCDMECYIWQWWCEAAMECKYGLFSSCLVYLIIFHCCVVWWYVIYVGVYYLPISSYCTVVRLRLKWYIWYTVIQMWWQLIFSCWPGAASLYCTVVRLVHMIHGDTDVMTVRLSVGPGATAVNCKAEVAILW